MPQCGSTERHRAFATFYRKHFDESTGFTGTRVLALRPDDADKAMLLAFGAAEVVSFDSFDRNRPDDRPTIDVEDPARQASWYGQDIITPWFVGRKPA